MIIATRTLSIRADSSNLHVVVNVFQPEGAKQDWTCRYQIDWPEGRRDSSAAGIDAIQALHLALQKIGVDLYMSEHHRLRRLFWINPDEGYGFPVPKNGRDFLIGLDKEFEG